MKYWHVQNEKSGAQALVRTWGNSAKVIAGSTHYEKFFRGGLPDTTIETPPVNFLLVGVRASSPIISTMMKAIGPRVEAGEKRTQRGSKVTDAVIKEITTLHSSGWSVSKISDALNLSRGTVYKYAS